LTVPAMCGVIAAGMQVTAGGMPLNVARFCKEADPLLPGQISNKFNWLAGSGASNREASACKAHETSVFSNTDTDKICKPRRRTVVEINIDFPSVNTV
jgi:hypothetical protein